MCVCVCALAVASMDEGKFVALSSSFAGNRFAVLAVAEADEVDYAAEAEPEGRFAEGRPYH